MVTLKSKPECPLEKAFWMLPQNPPTEPQGSNEIDVLEILSGKLETIHMTYHCTTSSAKGHVYTSPTMADRQWHTYGFQWNTDTMIWYIDGTARFNVSTCIPQSPEYLLLNIAIGGAWGGLPNASTPFPSSMDIAHVRAYKYIEDGGQWISGPGNGLSFTPAPAPSRLRLSNLVSSPSGGAPGSTINITLTITSGTASLIDGIIDIYPQNATRGDFPGSKVMRQMGINLAPGESATYTLTYTFPNNVPTGYYFFALGVFSKQWESGLLWQNSVAAYGINKPVGSGVPSYWSDEPEAENVPTQAPTTTEAIETPVSSSYIIYTPVLGILILIAVVLAL